jgi:hypothetical protein
MYLLEFDIFYKFFDNNNESEVHSKGRVSKLMFLTLELNNLISKELLKALRCVGKFV